MISARCSIYETRPQACKDFPTKPQEILSLPGCTYKITPKDGLLQITGNCNCLLAYCCSTPRLNGEPLAKTTPVKLGGKPCKYLIYK